jgi:hypothetical protein
VNALLAAAVATALALPGARAELASFRGGLAPQCRIEQAEVPRPVLASGRVAVHLLGSDAAGAPCDGWAWAEVRVHAPAVVATRALAGGEPLAGAAEPAWREVLPGRTPLAALPPGARAAGALRPGAVLTERDLLLGPRPGDPVTVQLAAGDLRVEARGAALPCRRGRACAALPSGRRVEGRWHEGRIVLETP